MSILMGLLEESIMFLSNANTVSLDEVEDLIVEQRNIVDEQRRLLQVRKSHIKTLRNIFCVYYLCLLVDVYLVPYF